MSDGMSIEDYLAQGGVLTSPANAPPRYRGELLRIMARFVDSELAGSAGFADMINAAPGIRERIAASRIVLQKAEHAAQVLAIMGDFGADVDRYASHYPWGERVARDTPGRPARMGDDMRLSVFHYPLQDWTDAVVMNVLMGTAADVQLQELTRISYAPLAEVFRTIAPREAEHTRLGLEGLVQICAADGSRSAAAQSVAFWRPLVAASFGHAASPRFEALRKFGLRHTPNEVLLSEWTAALDAALSRVAIEPN
ncbi:MAG TPA: Phenylacetic acid catabolic protein [Rhodopila sp.]|jgi:1,2-phenylacetyl-CoA epoxidase catalytic subunit|nr:Phenylacetic acid catabolic protein [Rhodopila sp.]